MRNEAAGYVVHLWTLLRAEGVGQGPPWSSSTLGAIVAFEVIKHYTELFDEAQPLENVIVQRGVSACKATALDEYNRDRYSKWWVQSDADLMDRAAAGGVQVICRTRTEGPPSAVRAVHPRRLQGHEVPVRPSERKSVEDRGSVDCP